MRIHRLLGGKQYPELVVSVQNRVTNSTNNNPGVHVSFKERMRVRLVGSNLTGQVGEIISLGDIALTLQNGLSVPAAQVELAGGEVKTIPLANLEVFDTYL